MDKESKDTSFSGHQIRARNEQHVILETVQKVSA